MNTPLISILIPAYNAADTIDECLQSILRQEGLETKQLQIVVLNDGSKDDTSEHVMQFQRKFPECIELHSRENRGIGPTRNELLSMARGEYVWMVDADDALEQGCWTLIEPHLRTGMVEMVMLSYLIRPRIGSGKVTHKIYRGEFSSGIELTRSGQYNNSLWSRIFLRKALLNIAPSFGKFSMGEDFDFIFRFTPHCGKTVCISQICYQYIITPHSATQERTLEHQRKVSDDSLQCILGYRDYFAQFDADTARILRMPLNFFILGYIYSLVISGLDYGYCSACVKRIWDAKLMPLSPLPCESNRQRIFAHIVNRAWLLHLLLRFKQLRNYIG